MASVFHDTALQKVARWILSLLDGLLNDLNGKLERFVAMYRGCCREILLTTLPGNYKHGRLNPLNSVVADTQLWYAKSRGIPVWDVYHAVGPAYWRANGMMDRQGVHFTGRGYAMQGRMLGQAIARRWLL